MAEIVGPGSVAASKNLYFTVTNTLRGEKVDVGSQSGNFVIDIDGTIYKISEPQPNSGAVTVIGGKDTFVHEKAERPYSFYITQRQKVSIYKIMFELAKVTRNAELHSDSEVLDHLITNTYSNYRG